MDKYEKYIFVAKEVDSVTAQTVSKSCVNHLIERKMEYNARRTNLSFELKILNPDLSLLN